MRFDELEKKLNEAVKNEGKEDSKSFDGKGALKTWIIKKTTELVGYNYIQLNWQEKDKYELYDTYNGNDNFVEIKYMGKIVAKINFKFTRTSEYRHWYTYTSYGIKSITVERFADWLSGNSFEDCIDEVKQRIIQEQKAHRDYQNSRHEQIKVFIEEHNNITLQEVLDIVKLLKGVESSEQKRYEQEFNNGEEFRWWSLYSRY